MKALGKLKPEVGLWMYDAKKPAVGPNDVLIKIKKTAICGTDLHIYQWDEWAQKNVPVPLTTDMNLWVKWSKSAAQLMGLNRVIVFPVKDI